MTFNPTAILIPPVEQQTYLRGLIAGTGSGSATNLLEEGGATANPQLGGTGSTIGESSSTSAEFAALFFDSNQFTPGQNISSTTLPTGVKQTGLTFGPQTGLTAANSSYKSLVYDTFADFGTPAFPPESGNPFGGNPGVSGVQGIGGDLLINLGIDPNVQVGTQAAPNPNIDLYPVAATDLRRFENVAFDQYGYFSQGLPTTLTATTTGQHRRRHGHRHGHHASSSTVAAGTAFTFGSPVYAGSLFVADLATGLSVSVPVPAPATGTEPTPAPPPILIPVQGPEIVTVSNPVGGGPITVTVTPARPRRGPLGIPRRGRDRRRPDHPDRPVRPGLDLRRGLRHLQRARRQFVHGLEPQHHLLGRRHHALRRRRRRHLAVQDHREPRRLVLRLDHRPERPADPGRPLRRPEQRGRRHRHRHRRLQHQLPGPRGRGDQHNHPRQ